jgi:hypothetical protein
VPTLSGSHGGLPYFCLAPFTFDLLPSTSLTHFNLQPFPLEAKGDLALFEQ